MSYTFLWENQYHQIQYGQTVIFNHIFRYYLDKVIFSCLKDSWFKLIKSFSKLKLIVIDEESEFLRKLGRKETRISFT